ncbi:MAG: hypothetical protein Q9168_002887 [Polycauliona sp. 1 TL-2023]
MSSELVNGTASSVERPPRPTNETSALSLPTIVTTVDIKALEYAGPVDVNLLCPICQCPFFLPVRLDCDHIFCSECLRQSIQAQEQRQSTCPTCRGPFDSTSPGAFLPIPRIINQLIESLPVKCPSLHQGCLEGLSRGNFMDHVEKYCPYTDVRCASDTCGLLQYRKDFAQGRCLHSHVVCQYCSQEFIERDLEDHRTNHCSFVTLICPHCDSSFLRHQFERHVPVCHEAVSSCEAAPYGCDFKSKAQTMDHHLKTCALAKLVPFLQAQNNRIKTQETALDLLKAKQYSLETVLSDVTKTLETCHTRQPGNELDTLGPRTHTPEPCDATTHHLLCGHETLRRDVERMSMEMSNLDAQTRMMILNESLHTKDELSRANAAISSIRMQLNWLSNSENQRGPPIRFHGASASAGVTVAGTDSRRPQSLQTQRRLSDEARQEPKL